PFGHEAAQELVAVGGQPAEGERRIEPVHHQGQAPARRVEVEAAVDAHAQAVPHAQPELVQERPQPGGHRGEAGDRERPAAGGGAGGVASWSASEKYAWPLRRCIPSISPRTHTPSRNPRRSTRFTASASSRTENVGSPWSSKSRSRAGWLMGPGHTAAPARV